MEPDVALHTLEQELERGRALIAEAGSLDELERARQAVLGRKAPFSEVQRSLGVLSEEYRRVVGHRANEVRAALEQAVAGRREALAETEERALLERRLGT